MNRSTVILVMDSALIAVAALIVILCVRTAIVSLIRRFVYINGKKVTVESRPVDYWAVIITLVATSILLSFYVVEWYCSRL